MGETKVTVIDSICGSGKTSWAIEEMNENIEQKYIYITPFLDEVKRVKEGCIDRYFCEPNEKLGKGSKYNHFVELLTQGKNIASTHAIFRNVNREVADLIKKHNYILILDEVLNVIEQNVISPDDFKILKQMKIIEVNEYNQINWIDEEYNGELAKYKNSCLNGDMFIVDDKVIMWTFPVGIFKSFKHIYIMTFLFEGQAQRYYYDMYNIEYDKKSVTLFDDVESSVYGRKYKLIEYKEADRTELKKLINIYEGKYNRIGDKKGRERPLSMGWFDRQVENKTDQLDKLKSNMEKYFKNSCKETLPNGKQRAYRGEFNLWTVPKKIAVKKGKNGKDNIIYKVRGNSNNFLAWSTRATNEYRHKINIAYCINLYMNVIDYRFFESRNIKINQDIWALGEMIQFIFRTQIRDGKPINIYIPSQRMRNLLINWLNS